MCAPTAPPFKLPVEPSAPTSQAFPAHQSPRDPSSSHPRSSLPPPSGVQGKLRLCLSFWKTDLRASKFVTDTIEYGYKIPFDTVPPPFYSRNNKSSLDHPDFVEGAISELIQNRCAVEVQQRPYCCNPLTVAQGKKLRLVLDLRHPNQFVLQSKFKYEDLTHIAQVLDTEQFYFSFDLKSGYHHVDIFPAHRQFLGFSWAHCDSVLRYYVFTVLPFGLNSASYLFTKLTRPLVYHWRSRGIHAYMYIDDGLIISPSLDSAFANLAVVKNTIQRSGFVPNESKCVWQPSARILYLGLLIDSPTSCFLVPQAKIDILFSSINAILSFSNSRLPAPVRSVASFAGQIMSMSLALGPVTRLMTRATYRAIESRSSWEDSLFITDSVLNELTFWNTHISVYNGFPFRFRLAPTMQIYSDASDLGFGGHVQDHPNLRVHGLWSPHERLRSSTWRELTAVFRVLKAFSDRCFSQKIKWFTDNSNVPRIIRHGSTKSDLHCIALDIFSYCQFHDIILSPVWLPRQENTVADKISKYRDYDDWSIDDQSFFQVNNLWGPHTVDRFASPHNAKLPAFNARFFCQGVSAVDAFCQAWENDNNYFCPPVSLIVQVIKRMALCRAIGTLIVPRWPTSHFWPYICPDGVHLDAYVHDWRLLNVSFTPSSLRPDAVFCEQPSFLTLALRYNFKRSPRTTNKGFCCSELGYCSSCV